jgi:hypothetical protein
MATKATMYQTMLAALREIAEALDELAQGPCEECEKLASDDIWKIIYDAQEAWLISSVSNNSNGWF